MIIELRMVLLLNIIKSNHFTGSRNIELAIFTVLLAPCRKLSVTLNKQVYIVRVLRMSAMIVRQTPLVVHHCRDNSGADPASLY